MTEELDIWVGLPAGVREPETPYQGYLFADYALLGSGGKPLAIVEAKKSSVDAEIGKEQARNYAEKIHRTTGAPMPFVFIRTVMIFTIGTPSDTHRVKF